MTRARVLWLLLALVGCGGGDPEPERTERVTLPDCAASEACR